MFLLHAIYFTGIFILVSTIGVTLNSTFCRKKKKKNNRKRLSSKAFGSKFNVDVYDFTKVLHNILCPIEKKESLQTKFIKTL